MATAASTRVLTVRFRSLIEYWHLLSLDAPTVAALWACALCIASGTSIRCSSIIFLALGTWLLYASDRILDGMREADVQRLRDRHYFHREHRKRFAIAAVVVCLLLLALAIGFLSRRALREFSMVLIAALGYFILVHRKDAGTVSWLPKEFAVGVVFAAAVGVPAWAQLPASSTRVLACCPALLAALFWLNCVAIESWESRPTAISNKVSKAASGSDRRWRSAVSPDRVVVLMSTAVALVAAFLVGTASRAGQASIFFPIYLSVMVSAAMLFQLDRMRYRFSLLRMRIAADAVLLTPLIFVILPRVLSSFGPAILLRVA